MCGIVGYIGQKPEALAPILEGLNTLEYRGYDSAGVTLLTKDRPLSIKQTGRVEGLALAFQGVKTTAATAGIAHTRWATHGQPSIANAHPHSNQDGSIFVVHNGIIENHQALRAKLQAAGYTFASETDTEVIPHLIDFYLKTSGKKEVKTAKNAFDKDDEFDQLLNDFKNYQLGGSTKKAEKEEDEEWF